jgi:hypothetical protein
MPPLPIIRIILKSPSTLGVSPGGPALSDDTSAMIAPMQDEFADESQRMIPLLLWPGKMVNNRSSSAASVPESGWGFNKIY